eukprot:5140271-Pleurochrysis_carterae.AAC.1
MASETPSHAPSADSHSVPGSVRRSASAQMTYPSRSQTGARKTSAAATSDLNALRAAASLSQGCALCDSGKGPCLVHSPA